MVLMLEASEKFTLREEKTWRNYRRITEGSGENSSNQKSPEKEESPKERDSDEEKYPTTDKGKRKSLYFSCPRNNCSGYQNDVRSSSTSLIVKGLKCVKCDKKMRYGENLKEHCEECHEGKKKEKESIEGCERCDKSWKDCTCKCRKHGDIINCALGEEDECYHITQEEYEVFTTKSAIFQALVRMGTYKWNGETYEMINELNDEEQEKEDTKFNEDEDLWEERDEEIGTSNKYGTVDEWLKNTSAYEQLRKKLENLGKSGNQDENVIKGQEISSPQQHSENSEKSEKQNLNTYTQALLRTPSTTDTQTPTTSGTNTPTSQNTLNLIFNTPPLINMTDYDEQAYRNEMIRLQRVGDVEIECFYGKESVNPIEWFNKIQAVAVVRKWGKGANDLGDDNGRLRAAIAATYLRGEALKWFNDLANNAIGHWDTDDADSFKTLFINAMWTDQKKEGWFYELQEMKKGVGETVEEYTRRFKQKKNRADPTGLYPPRFIANTFVQGLDAKSQGLVLMQAPGTLEDAVKYAKQAELVVKIEAGDSSVFEQDKAQIQNQIRIQKEHNKGPVNTQEIDELAAQMEKLKLAMIGISKQQNVQPRNNYPNYRPINNYPNYPNYPPNYPQRKPGYGQPDYNEVCNYCNKLGHNERKCFRKHICKNCNVRGHTEDICYNQPTARREMNYINEEYYTPQSQSYYDLNNTEEEYYDDYSGYEQDEYSYYEMNPALGRKKNTRREPYVPQDQYKETVRPPQNSQGLQQPIEPMID